MIAIHPKIYCSYTTLYDVKLPKFILPKFDCVLHSSHLNSHIQCITLSPGKGQTNFPFIIGVESNLPRNIKKFCKPRASLKQNEHDSSSGGPSGVSSDDNTQKINTKAESRPPSSAPGLPKSALPTDIITWGGKLTFKRRLALSSFLGVAIVLGGNLGGVTSLLLGMFPEFSRKQNLDVLFPVAGFRRCVETSRGFEFVYPSDWMGDQTLLNRAVRRAELQRSLDLPSLRVERERERRRSAMEPLVAFGPPGSEGELNISVVVAPVAPGFSLSKLGGPEAAGDRILKSVIAPEGSEREAVLISANERKSGQILYYTLEFSVKSPTFSRHNIAVYATYNDLLYTLNAQTPESLWKKMESQFSTVAASFQVIDDKTSANDIIPSRL